jgi:hypothetical protein
MEAPLAPVLPLKIAAAVARFDSEHLGWRLLDPHSDAPRSYATRIEFESPFQFSPVVHVGVSGFDIENSDAARLRVRVTHVDQSGFEVELETWLATRIWSVDVSWLAIGT